MGKLTPRLAFRHTVSSPAMMCHGPGHHKRETARFGLINLSLGNLTTRATAGGGDVGSPLTSLIPVRYFSKIKGELMGKMEVL